ncbi:uncharacterized protein LOC110987144 [Acanthaster planci]|uniref:Netrin receptor UNC5 n=1 Tax=Acanthaster planci TaxID=133434 RepID=A0A8B7ZJV2_ACAPL|nr:uncharacterized protein LOC110987144 [Acanthaster planci]XP_022105308.1 uncharacterized protein LOC110987144 [Acanthaster planci]
MNEEISNRPPTNEDFVLLPGEVMYRESSLDVPRDASNADRTAWKHLRGQTLNTSTASGNPKDITRGRNSKITASLEMGPDGAGQQLVDRNSADSGISNGVGALCRSLSYDTFVNLNKSSRATLRRHTTPDLVIERTDTGQAMSSVQNKEGHLREDDHLPNEIQSQNATGTVHKRETGARRIRSTTMRFFRSLCICIQRRREMPGSKPSENHGFVPDGSHSSSSEGRLIARHASLGEATADSLCTEGIPDHAVPSTQSPQNLKWSVFESIGISLDESTFIKLFDRACQKAKEMDYDVVGRVVQIANFAAAMLDSRGGFLSVDALDVHLFIPPGAIPANGRPQRVYIYVQGSLTSGCNYLTPYVLCGPSEVDFVKDVILTLPHCAKVDPYNEFTCVRVSTSGLSTIRGGNEGAVCLQSKSFTIMTNHFCGFAVFGPIEAKFMLACIFIKDNKDEVQIRVRLFDDTKANLQEVAYREMKNGFTLANTTKRMEVRRTGSDVLVTLNTDPNSWECTSQECQTFQHSSLWRESSQDIVPVFQSKLFSARCCKTGLPFTANMKVCQKGNETSGVEFVLERLPTRVKTGSSTHSLEKQEQHAGHVMLEQMKSTVHTDARTLDDDTYRRLCNTLDRPQFSDLRHMFSKTLLGQNGWDYGVITCIEKRAGVGSRSPTSLVLDTFFAASKGNGKTKLSILKELKQGLHKMNSTEPDFKLLVDSIDRAILELHLQISKRSNASKIPCTVGSRKEPFTGHASPQISSSSDRRESQRPASSPPHPPSANDPSLISNQDLTLDRGECLASFDRMWSKAKSMGIDIVGRGVQIGNFAAAVLDTRGGYLSVDASNVHFYVPPGAIAADESPQRVYIFVEGCISSGCDFLTPSVHCGPSTLHFRKDVILTVPHCACYTLDCNLTFVKATKGKQTRTIKDGEDGVVVVKNKSVTLTMDHFCRYGASGFTSGRYMLVCVFLNQTNDKEVRIRVRLLNNTKTNLQEVKDEERECGFLIADPVKELRVQRSGKGVVAKLSSTTESWKITYPECCKQEIEFCQLWREYSPDNVRCFPSRLFYASRQSSETAPFEARMTVFQVDREQQTVEFAVQRCPTVDNHPNPCLSSKDLDHLFWRMLQEENVAPVHSSIRPIDEDTFTRLCELLDTPRHVDWHHLPEFLYDRREDRGTAYVHRIEARAGRERRSPTELVLDLYFAESKDRGKYRVHTLLDLKQALIGFSSKRPDVGFAIAAIDVQLEDGELTESTTVQESRVSLIREHAKVHKTHSSESGFLSGVEDEGQGV